MLTDFNKLSDHAGKFFAEEVCPKEEMCKVSARLKNVSRSQFLSKSYFQNPPNMPNLHISVAYLQL